MKKKLWALAAALLGMLAVNLHLCCAVGFGGEAPAGRYVPADVARALKAADRAAEEILPGEGTAARPRLRCVLSLRVPEDDSRRVADAALRATEGVTVLDGVFLNGAQLGAVERGARFAGRLQAWLYDSMPRQAREAGLVEELEFRALYARAGSASDPGELLCAVTAVAHVWYADGEGKPVSG